MFNILSGEAKHPNSLNEKGHSQFVVVNISFNTSLSITQATTVSGEMLMDRTLVML